MVCMLLVFALFAFARLWVRWFVGSMVLVCLVCWAARLPFARLCFIAFVVCFRVALLGAFCIVFFWLFVLIRVDGMCFASCCFCYSACLVCFVYLL